MNRSELLFLDGIGNVVLGLVLLVAPVQLATWLGVTTVTSAFYPSLFGAVLVGIGIALLWERYRSATAAPGLGLVGALTINSCFGVVLVGWLLFSNLTLPLRGAVLLWGLAIILIVLSVVEFLAETRRSSTSRLTSP